MQRLALLLLMAGFGVALAFAGEVPRSKGVEPNGTPLTLAGLNNVFRITDGLYSGSSPEGDPGFRSLKELGIKTVISVDGARPDVELARRYGLRYVHLPVGYDGISREQSLRLAKAVRDLPGPIYVHCHHGKHRGPTAAAIAHLCLDARCPVDAVIAEMHRAGTDPRYKGLYASSREFSRPTSEELDRQPADFPEAVRVAALAEIMVGVDERWGRIEEIRAAGWRVPPAHPDLDPPHEALQLLEQFREAARLAEAQGRPEPFRRFLEKATASAQELEDALRHPNPARPARATEAFRHVAADCTGCHAAYRDVSKH
jgi:protein tyrosine phosphatase (PTP) superfamily phosphohydrolase (DUF442 family)